MNDEKNALKGVNTTQSTLDAGAALGLPKQVPGYTPVVIVPEGYKAEPFTVAELPKLPDHIRQRVTLEDAGSLIDYVNRYKTTQTVIFGKSPRNGETASFTAVLDFHVGEEEDKKDGGAADTQANRCAHLAEYACPFSMEWQIWNAVNLKPMSQAEAVVFFEDNSVDVVQPDAASLLEMARNFASHTEVKFASKINQTTGGVSVSFQEEDAGATGVMTIPNLLQLSLPVFQGGVTVELCARLEWKPRDGKLTLTVRLLRPRKVLEKALSEMADVIREKTGVPMFAGNAKPQPETTF